MRVYWFSFLLLIGGVVSEAPAQPRVISPDRLVEVATFEEARSIARAPDGTIYVVDAGEDVVVRLLEEGARRERLGGPGRRAGQFDGPADLATSDGYVLLVADAGNGRVQRFSREFRHLETLPLEQHTPRSGSGAAVSSHAPDDTGWGRPVAVAISAREEIFVLDADAARVIRWSADRSRYRVVGGFGARAGRLEAPTDLCVFGDMLLVADPGQGRVLAYDALGSFLYPFLQSAPSGVRRIRVQGNSIWLLADKELVRYTASGEEDAQVSLDLDEPVVDFWVGAEGCLFLLSEKSLYRATP